MILGRGGEESSEIFRATESAVVVFGKRRLVFHGGEALLMDTNDTKRHSAHLHMVTKHVGRHRFWEFSAHVFFAG